MLILTATDRLARALREDDSLARRAAGAGVWEAPQIKSLRQWVQDQWTASWPPEQLLDSTQELALWTEAVLADSTGLIAPLAAAREARRTEQLVHRHALVPERWGSTQEEHLAFLRWRRRVQARKRREGWITAAELPAAVAQAIREKRIRVPEALRLQGFVEDPAPAEQALLEALAQAGTRIEHAETPPRTTTPQRLRPADPEAQYRLIGLALRERLKRLGPDDLPPRLILALPDPEAARDLIERLFRPLLAPWLDQPGEGSRPVPWRWGRGRPLAEQPWIAVALGICQLRPGGNAPADLSRLLLSTALWTGEDRPAAAEADLRLRDRGWPRVRWLRLLEALPAALRPRFEALGEVMARAARRGLPSDWAQHYRDRLNALGWPGRGTLDSAAYQAVADWDALLHRLSAMDAQLGAVESAVALRWLGELARATRFEPRAEYPQPIQILPLEEAVGLPCDALYVGDLLGGQFPGPAQASPLLPLEAQQRAGIPAASPGLWLAQARRLATHLAVLAPEVRLYAPAADAQGAEADPTPLFGASAPWQAVASPGPSSGLDHYLAAGRRCQWPDHDPVPAVDARERTGLRADSALFATWFEAPFFAFCRYRLGITALPERRRGLDPRKQGTLAHSVLEHLWRQLGSSSGLAALDDAALAGQLAGILQTQLARSMPEADYGAVQVALERARQADVLGQWMAHERRRVEPFSVEFLEAELHTEVGGLPLHLRIDRIDRVHTADGDRWLVLDYKTGREADPRGWEVDRLREPQLPLYASHAVGAATGVPRVDGLCFAHLRDGHPALAALTNWRQLLIEPGSEAPDPDWEARLAAWRVALANVAQRFLAGEAGLGHPPNERSHHADLLLLVGRDTGDEA